MNELTGIPTVVLEAEIRKRSEQAEKDRHALTLERSKILGEALRQPGVVDALAPEHDRTSCTDEGLENGHATEYRLPRCSRCQLLYAAKVGVWPTYLSLRLDIVHNR